MNNELILTQDVVYIPTKSEIALAADKLVSNVIEGEMNALLAYGQLAALEQTIKEAKERIAESALAEAERYEGGGRQLFGAFNCEFQVKESGVKYDYSENEHWRSLKEQVDLASAELKGHETVLRKMGMCAKSSKTIVQVNLKK